VEFASPSKPDRVLAALAPVSPRAACAVVTTRRARESPLLGFLLPRAQLRRVPLLRSAAVLRPQRRGWRSPNPHRCRPQGSCPSRRFWLRSRHARDPCGSRRSPWRPDASRSCSIPLAPLESPCRAFPSRGAVPALAGLVLPCGFAFDRPTARQVRGFRDPFPRCADLSPRLARRLAGLGGRDDGSPESLGAARHALPRSFTASRLESAGLAAYGSRHARFEALLPSRVRSRGSVRPGQGTAAGSVLSWVCPSRACSREPWVRCSRDGRGRDEPVPRLSSRARLLATCSPGPCSDRGA